VLRDQFATEIPKAQASAVRVFLLKHKAAPKEMEDERQRLEAMYAALSKQIKEMEDLAKEYLAAKPPARPVAVDSGHPAGSWEARQTKLSAEFRALMGEIEKTKIGSALLTAGPMADPDKVTSGMNKMDAARVKRLLVIREQFGLLVPQGQKALDRWEKAKLEFGIKEPNYKAGVIAASEWEQAKLELNQAERAMQTTGDALAALLADLDKVAKELGVVAGKAPDPLEADYKKVMAEYDALALRLAKTRVGRLLAVFPPQQWPSTEVEKALANDEKKTQLGIRLLTLRDQFREQSLKAEGALSAKRQNLFTKGLELSPHLDELILKNEQEVQFRTAAMRGILDDLKKLADEIDPPANKGPMPGK
jgi:hypothetical protein